MKPLQKSMLKIRQSYFNLSKITLPLFLCIVVLTSCTTTSSDEGTVVLPPPVSSPLELGDISLVSSAGDSSSYAAARVTIEGAVIVISDIPNLADTTTETLTVSITDKEDPVTYTVEPASVTIPAAVLNPEGTAAVRTRLENVEFVLTPTVAGGEPITYGVEVRLDEFIVRTPLIAGDITIAAGSHPAYADAIISVNDNIITISGIKNKEDGFSEDLTLMIKDATDPAEYEVLGDAVTLLGSELNPDGVASISTVNNEALTVTVTPTAPGGTPVKYYVHLMLGDLIQLNLFGGSTGDLEMGVILLEGSSGSSTITMKNCAVVSSLRHEVIVAGRRNPAYSLTSTINPYIDAAANLVVSEGNDERATFAVSVVESCTKEALLGAGTSGDPYIIDNDRKLDLVARLVNANEGSYRSAHYRVTARIDLGVALAPWSETSSMSTTPNGPGFTPIGTSSATNFAGTFDCNANEIANLYISRDTIDYVGLFGYVSSATIQNCALTAVKVTGRANVGGLVGWSAATTTVSRSYASGSVAGGDRVGGLIGNNQKSAISTSYAAVVVSGDTNIGGLVGHNNNNGSTPSTINDSYAVGSVSGTSSVGGLVGLNFGSAINNSYAIGSVTGTNDVGGLVGKKISANAGGSYWDTDTTGRSTSSGGTGQTTAQLQAATSTSYTGWLDTVWEFAPNNQYPRLKNVVCANRQYNQAATECTGL